MDVRRGRLSAERLHHHDARIGAAAGHRDRSQPGSGDDPEPAVDRPDRRLPLREEEHADARVLRHHEERDEDDQRQPDRQRHRLQGGRDAEHELQAAVLRAQLSLLPLAPPAVGDRLRTRHRHPERRPRHRREGERRRPGRQRADQRQPGRAGADARLCTPTGRSSRACSSAAASRRSTSRTCPTMAVPFTTAASPPSGWRGTISASGWDGTTWAWTSRRTFSQRRHT